MIDKIQAKITVNSCKIWIDKTMQSKFASALANKMEEKHISASELARKAQTTRANVSRLLNDTPHPISGAAPKPSEETVEKIAKALDWDLDEARLAAGYAPLTIATDFDEKVRVAFHGAHEWTDDEKQRALNFVRTFVAGVRAERQQEEEQQKKRQGN